MIDASDIDSKGSTVLADAPPLNDVGALFQSAFSPISIIRRSFFDKRSDFVDYRPTATERWRFQHLSTAGRKSEEKTWKISQKCLYLQRERSQPTTTENMPKVLYIKKHPFGKNFFAITLTEFILTVAPLNQYDLNHEMIHVKQQRELLYLPFFIWYVVEWLILYCKYRDSTKAYFNIRFEKEAYKHQGDLSYLKRRRHYNYLWTTCFLT